MKLITFGQEPPYDRYRSQLFNVTADPAEVHDLAGAQPELVAQMKAKLAKELDYVGISNTVAEEGRAFVQRWSQNFTATEIEALITTAYDHVQKDDIARFWRWLSEIGEFA